MKKLYFFLISFLLVISSSSVYSSTSTSKSLVAGSTTGASKFFNLNQGGSLAIRHGAAIDGIFQTHANFKVDKIGGNGGSEDKFKISKLIDVSSIKVYEGDFQWGGRHIVKITFYYRDGSSKTIGETSYSSNIKTHNFVTHANKQLVGITGWSNGWLLDGIQLHYDYDNQSSKNNSDKTKIQGKTKKTFESVFKRVVRKEDSETIKNWFPGFQLGVNTYYRTNANNTPVCYSLDGEDCAWMNFGTNKSSKSISVLKDTDSKSKKIISSFKDPDKTNAYLKRYGAVSIKLESASSSISSNITLPHPSYYSIPKGATVLVDIGYKNTKNSKKNNTPIYIAYNYVFLMTKDGGRYAFHFDGKSWVNTLNAGKLNTSNIKPVACDFVKSKTPTWCKKLSRAEASMKSINLNVMVNNKREHLKRLLDNWEKSKSNKVDKKYLKTILNQTVDERLDDIHARARERCIGLLVSLPLIGGFCVAIETKKIKGDYIHEEIALKASLKSEKMKVKSEKEAALQMGLSKLHKGWKKNDITGFEALIKEESMTLETLEKLQKSYSMSAEEEYKEYLKVYKKLKKEDSQIRALADTVKTLLPIVGGTISSELYAIADYKDNPTKANLVKMLKAGTGVAGKIVDTVTELSNTAKLSKDKVSFLTKVIGTVSDDVKTGKSFGGILADIVNALSDEAIESVRELGLWSDHKEKENTLQINASGIVEVRALATIGTYDPWLDMSKDLDPFRKMFTPQLSVINSKHKLPTKSGTGNIAANSIKVKLQPIGGVKVAGKGKYGTPDKPSDKSSDKPSIKVKFELIGDEKVSDKDKYKHKDYDLGLADLYELEKVVLGYMSNENFTWASNLQEHDLDLFLKSASSKFNDRLTSLFYHTFGKGYADVARKNAKYKGLTDKQINYELYKFIADPAYSQERVPYWVDSSVIGARPAGFLYNDDHGVILLNKDLVKLNSKKISKFYLEELGHALNWWRCKIFEVSVSHCKVNGDAGARFRDAVLIDPDKNDKPFEVLVTSLPPHTGTDVEVVTFNNAKNVAFFEGWPSYYTVNDHLIDNAKLSWLLRLGVNIGSEFPMLSDEFDLELIINSPVAAPKGDPWGDPSGKSYCKTDTEKDCNMPTMWLNVSFRDAIKVSVFSSAKLKNLDIGGRKVKDMIYLSPRLVRKHGGKLPFQLQSVNTTDWKYYHSNNIYFKKFIIGLVGKSDFVKVGRSVQGMPLPKTHKPEIAMIGTLGDGSYEAAIAVRDKSTLAEWLAIDIVTSVGGCVGGAALGIFIETDPVLLCHVGSVVLEGVASALEVLDRRVTVIGKSSSNVSLPFSLEYKYAAAKKDTKVAEDTTAETEMYSNERRVYTVENDSTIVRGGGIAEERTVFRGAIESSSAESSQLASKFSAKASRAWSKTSMKIIEPIMVFFRPRLTFTHTKGVFQRGTYDLQYAGSTSD